MANVIAFGQRLAGRMVQVGGQATGRMDWGREEEMARREREVAWLENTSSRDIVKRGQFWQRFYRVYECGDSRVREEEVTVTVRAL